jgi:hypothetical protein
MSQVKLMKIYTAISGRWAQTSALKLEALNFSEKLALDYTLS